MCTTCHLLPNAKKQRRDRRWPTIDHVPPLKETLNQRQGLPLTIRSRSAFRYLSWSDALFRCGSPGSEAEPPDLESAELESPKSECAASPISPSLQEEPMEANHPNQTVEITWPN